MKHLRNAVGGLFTAAAVLTAPLVANAQIYAGETAGVGDPVHTMFVAFAN
ncbi:hypothetical protein [Pseudooctadecabacter jejudonensis]|uniref:Uncharacterized protein n=1 Tax=Pseudooctadecabacter jejudonensis TaxID=1391910 RepID=A0A1Y5SX09_9RHOB|nr:hypothetical protein [Pseudooctadecabacter jejudonensis]SLN48492.1 hypothetical protein PSJ8397_02485 [Pseudooctadecabacter jejudonensis]